MNVKAEGETVEGWDESWDRGEDQNPDSPDPAKPTYSENSKDESDSGNKDDSSSNGNVDDNNDNSSNGNVDNNDGGNGEGEEYNKNDFVLDVTDEELERMYEFEPTFYASDPEDPDTWIDGYALVRVIDIRHLDGKIVLPSTYKGEPVLGIGSGRDPKITNKKAFYNNSLVKEVYIPSSVKHINAFAFQGCKNLSNIHFEPGCQTTLGFWSFADCSSLREARIPSGVTADRLADAFYQSAVKTLYLEKGVTSATFQGVFNMSVTEKIYFDGNLDECIESLWAACSIAADARNNGTLYCNDGEYRYNTLDYYYEYIYQSEDV